ncbi:MAG TPA: SRPBCC domain-containing protein [Candidatus Saccharimonadales bacterium]|jgi:uncharacterized protein YndB with AHSA1/START domain
MKSNTYSATINVPVQKVWDTMLSDATYRQWTGAFYPGSYYEGDWEKGSDIQFLGPDEDGNLGGLSGTIIENKPHEFISIEYKGEIINGELDTTSESSLSWAGATENYTFSEQDGVTTVTVELASTVDIDEMMGDAWPKGLAKLKELCEAA